MKNEQAVVLHRNHPEDDWTVVGPFESSKAANSWGFANLKGCNDWHWLPLTNPEATQ